jgi:hypothetical protein
MWRRVWSIVAAFAWIVGTSAALADEGKLTLPAAMSPEALAKASARGGTANAEAEAVAEPGHVQSNASAQASVGPIMITGPLTTGNVGGFPGIDGASGQISTGVGNIQQGVSAVAILN